jgi:hypothetical protein
MPLQDELREDSRLEIEVMRHRLRHARRFIYAQMKHAENYGSNFSSGVFFECQQFLKDNAEVRESNHTVVRKAYLRRLQQRGIELLKLKNQLRKLESARAKGATAAA